MTTGATDKHEFEVECNWDLFEHITPGLYPISHCQVTEKPPVLPDLTCLTKQPTTDNDRPKTEYRFSRPRSPIGLISPVSMLLIYQ